MTSPTDPFRFEDRTGHYGSGQADLAPVSPLAAAPRDDGDDRPLDPMGASPSEGRTADSGQTTPDSADRADMRADVRSDAQIATIAQPVAVSAQAGSGVEAQTSAVAGAHEAPVREDAAPTQTVLLRGQADARAEGEGRADTATAPVMSAATPVSLLPDAGPETSQAVDGFADMAARMDQMMAEMALQTSRPPADDEDDEPGSDQLADVQDRLDDLFGSLGDQFGGGAASADDALDTLDAARDRFDDLAADLKSRDLADADTGSDPLSDAAAHLDALQAGLGRHEPTGPDGPAPPTPQAPLLARLFDGDAAPDEPSADEARLAELLDEMEAPTFTPPVPDFDPGGWDDLPDFG